MEEPEVPNQRAPDQDRTMVHLVQGSREKKKIYHMFSRSLNSLYEMKSLQNKSILS